jgi:hypothetical protein
MEFEITSVKQAENGWIINNQLSVPNDPANRHCQMVLEWISQGNIPQPHFTQEELDDQTAALVSAQNKQFLIDTDWKILRHRDQLELGIPTSLTNEEFIQLLQDRQTARDLI